MNQLQEIRTLEVIGAEIREHANTMEYHMRGTVYEAVEIGRRLVEARDVAQHGEWMAFLERETPFSHDKANNLIKVFEAYGDKQKSLFGTELSNSDTYRNLSFSQALALLALPSGEREEFVETHAVEDMTTRELQAAIRRQKELEQERDAARATLQTTEARLADTQKMLTESGDQNRELQQKLRQAQADVQAADDEATENERQLKERIKELEARPVDVAVQVDEAAVKKAADEARAAADAEWSAKVKAAEDKLAKAEEKAKKAAEKAKSAGESAGKESAAELEAAKREAETARAEAERLRKQLAMSDAAVTTFKVHFANWQREYQAMTDALSEADEETGGKLRAAIAAQMNAWKDGVA